MLSPVGGLGETILDADADSILMGVNRSMPAMRRHMVFGHIVFGWRSRKRSRRCRSRVGEFW